MTCKDCLHYGVCMNPNDTINICKLHQDKAEWVHLPCKVMLCGDCKKNPIVAGRIEEICRCGGDRSKCDFYESVRAKAINVLENTAETREYVESLPKIYMIARWAGYGVREFPFAGKCDDKGTPFVYVHDDCNGTCDCYFLRKLTSTTTGWIYAWTASERRAKEIAAALNEAAGESWRNE